jgi:hypothetical protein
MNDFQTIPNQPQPNRVLHAIVIMRERTASVVRRVNEHTLDLARKLLLQRLKCRIPDDRKAVL